MDFIEATKTCLRKYFVFSGRARRSEFWYFYLFTVIGGLVFFIIDLMIFPSARLSVTDQATGGLFEKPLNATFGYLTLIPTISAASRRLHDIGRSGFYQLIPWGAIFVTAGLIGYGATGGDLPGFAVPTVSIITVLIFIAFIVALAHDEGPGENRFGPSPKYGGDASVFE